MMTFFPSSHAGFSKHSAPPLTADALERPNLNTGLPWSGMLVHDLRLCISAGCTLEETADFLCGLTVALDQSLLPAP